METEIPTGRITLTMERDGVKINTTCEGLSPKRMYLFVVELLQHGYVKPEQIQELKEELRKYIPLEEMVDSMKAIDIAMTETLERYQTLTKVHNNIMDEIIKKRDNLINPPEASNGQVKAQEQS